MKKEEAHRGKPQRAGQQVGKGGQQSALHRDASTGRQLTVKGPFEKKRESLKAQEAPALGFCPCLFLTRRRRHLLSISHSSC